MRQHPEVRKVLTMAQHRNLVRCALLALVACASSLTVASPFINVTPDPELRRTAPGAPPDAQSDAAAMSRRFCIGFISGQTRATERESPFRRRLDRIRGGSCWPAIRHQGGGAIRACTLSAPGSRGENLGAQPLRTYPYRRRNRKARACRWNWRCCVRWKAASIRLRCPRRRPRAVAVRSETANKYNLSRPTAMMPAGHHRLDRRCAQLPAKTCTRSSATGPWRLPPTLG